ncbi:MAG TPA: amidohydrolase [Candidatus Cloacimonas sp.]|nr:amidohydrolase [Candidatus Cloacimonas sp.]
MLNLKKIRRDLHQIPELAFKEHKTRSYILSILKNYPQLQLHTFDFTGIVAEYTVDDKAYTLYRADMDALPICEQTGCEFTSQHPGFMHACCHDMHMAILLGLIDKVITENVQQNLLFVFQPAEEGFGGAKKMLQTGFFQKFNIERAFALHVSGKLPVGKVSSKNGYFFANSEEIEVHFYAQGGHVAYPGPGKNALQAGVQFYQLFFEQLHLRYGSSDIICDFGKMKAGTAMNAIPSKCSLEGTLRSFNLAAHREVKNLLKDTAKKIATKYKVEYQVKFGIFYAAVHNSDKLFNHFKQVIKQTEYEFELAEKVYAGEDFGFFAQKFPGLLFWLGTNDSKQEKDLHEADFLPSESALEIGVDIFYKLL